MVGTSETRMAGTSGTRDGWNQGNQGWLEPVGPGMAGTSGTRKRWLEPVGKGMAGTSGTRDGRN
jgi:hypothetical protein